MSDLCPIADYITEAEQHIWNAEAILKDLEEVRTSEARRLRACMYIAAMRRLKRMIEIHRTTVEAEAVVLPAPVMSGQPRLFWWLAPRPAIESRVGRRRAS
jgi:hypothetical protein